MRAVNLLPRDEQKARIEGKQLPVFVACGGIALVTILFVLLGLSASGAADDKRAELLAAQIAVAKLPQATGAGLSTGLISQERTDRVTALSAALSTQVSFDRLMRQVSRVLPEEVWLTKFTAATPASLTGTPSTPAAPAASTSSTSSSTTPAATPVTVVPDTVTIEGTTYTQEGVAHFLSRLAVVPTLTNVRLTSTTLVDPTTKKGKRLVNFVVTGALRTGSAS